MLRCSLEYVQVFLLLQETKLAETQYSERPARGRSIVFIILFFPPWWPVCRPLLLRARVPRPVCLIFFKPPSEVAPRASVPTLHGSVRLRPVCRTPLFFFYYNHGGQCAITEGAASAQPLHSFSTAPTTSVSVTSVLPWPVCLTPFDFYPRFFSASTLASLLRLPAYLLL